MSPGMNTYTQTCACVCNHTHTNKIKRPYLSSPKYQNASWNEHKHATCACVCKHTHTNKIKRPYLSSLCVWAHIDSNYI